MEKHGIFPAHLELELTDRLEEWQALNVAGGAADFSNDDVGLALLLNGIDSLFDLIGDMRDDLDGLAEVVAAPLLGEDALVNLAGGQVIGPAQSAGCEPFVVAEVEVGFGTIVEHIDLAVLERIHRPRVHIEVGIELLKHHLEPARLKQSPQGCGREAFAQGGYHPARYEDILHDSAPHAKRFSGIELTGNFL